MQFAHCGARSANNEFLGIQGEPESKILPWTIPSRAFRREPPGKLWPSSLWTSLSSSIRYQDKTRVDTKAPAGALSQCGIRGLNRKGCGMGREHTRTLGQVQTQRSTLCFPISRQKPFARTLLYSLFSFLFSRSPRHVHQITRSAAID